MKKSTIINVDHFLFHVSIIVKTRGGQYIETINWKGLRFELVSKYKWYFEYRAALLKVSNPKQIVDLSFNKYLPETRSDKDIVINNIRNLWIAKKRKITEIQNKLILARNSWNKLFPIEDDHLYKKAINKLTYITEERDRYEDELDVLSK